METQNILLSLGIVKEVGSNVQRFKVGDHMSTHAEIDALYTFNGVDADGTITKGGYSSHIVVHEMKENYPLASAAPLLCAGIIVYASMVRHKMNQPGKSLGVIGLGGLGHMAVKFGKALKSDEGLVKSLDFIIDTASGDHPFDPYMELLKTGGVLVLVGFPSMKSISGSVTGGTKDIQEMIDFCASHGIHPMIEIIPIQYANEAIERLLKSDVKYQFVIDIENSLK
ncbi:putative cinnamyl alcohol dehydrogenase 1 [Prunus yedoensis var. nudiflora]|uniref:Putative cinnamyl alcohol dehydrogenase 1 n=1 Tax=Prunus yedoensis var. nudiflora TaxID=2094558 RepID=A0A314Y4C6_PRUYE|nr:putative cinnamyl alcohol dehydrogenase 1 [Prunus yedoensis var. nudiflora]